MHELSVTESILDIVLRHAEQAGASQVTNIYLVLGDLASIVDDSVAFYWDMISADTMAQGAKLHFQRIRTEMECLDCQTHYEPSEGDLGCPECHGRNVKVVSGEEFFIDSIEVEFEGDRENAVTGDTG